MPFERKGRKPFSSGRTAKRSVTRRIAEDIAALQAEGFGSIAVITKTAADSRDAYEVLKTQGARRLRLITKETAAFEMGRRLFPRISPRALSSTPSDLRRFLAGVFARKRAQALLYGLHACDAPALLYASEDGRLLFRAWTRSLYLTGRNRADVLFRAPAFVPGFSFY